MKYDNWKLMAPLDSRIYGRCAYCPDVIYEGEDVLDTNRGTIHEDCLLQMAYEEFNCRKREAREENGL